MADFIGSVDGFMSQQLAGWIWDRAAPDASHSVGAFVGDVMLAAAEATSFRGDLKEVGIGDGRCAFFIPLNESQLALIDELGGEVVLRVLDESAFEIGRYVFFTGMFDERDARLGTLGTLLFSETTQLIKLRGRLAEEPAGARAASHPDYLKLFAPAWPDDRQTGKPAKAPPPSAYLEYVRQRSKVNKPFALESNPEELAHFLMWYVTHYCSLRNPLRAPLSSSDIDYLNEGVVIGNQRFTASRATWAAIMGHMGELQPLDFNNPQNVARIYYWWAVKQAKHLSVEDCLVPRHYIALLASPDAHQQSPFPSNPFLQHFLAGNPQLAMLDSQSETDRALLVCALLLMAVSRPDYLRYLPKRSVRNLFEEKAGEPSLFSRFLEIVTQKAIPSLSLNEYKRLIAGAGFDMDAGKFLCISREGHRAEAIRLRRPDPGDVVDVQLIGPFEKASGLGQATRLSAEVLDALDLSTNYVDFDLDNPAPEGFSKVGTLSKYKAARVNLIHLNAESIPLAHAYQPDVFTGAYNIGYFYWELNTPASCHFLALDLLDEIWLSSDYGVSIYKPVTKLPVVNVGMCYEKNPDLDRAASRDFVTRKFGFEGDEFVFLVAFDSFSFIQRKNPVGVLRSFMAAFPAGENVRLVIKTQNRDRVLDPIQQRIWDQVERMTAGDPRILILDETLHYTDLLKLKQGSDCYISLHKSEGWGFGMIEAMNLKVPVVCTAYSANLEFCREDTAWLVGYTEVFLDPDDYIFVTPGQKWAEPDVEDAARQLRAVFENKEERERRADAAYAYVHRNFSTEAIARRYGERLSAILATRRNGSPDSQ